MKMIRFSLRDVLHADAEWLQALLTREGKNLGTAAELVGETELRLRW
jgi:hypothetical protein